MDVENTKILCYGVWSEYQACHPLGPSPPPQKKKKKKKKSPPSGTTWNWPPVSQADVPLGGTNVPFVYTHWIAWKLPVTIQSWSSRPYTAPAEGLDPFVHFVCDVFWYT